MSQLKVYSPVYFGTQDLPQKILPATGHDPRFVTNE